MQLTETYAFNYVLKPNSSSSAQIPASHQTLGADHKLVMAYASLSQISHHSNNPPSAAAHVGFGDFVQNGQSKDAKGLPLLLGENITDVEWTFKADRCWARAVIVIHCWD
jgi:hypothetical protein